MLNESDMLAMTEQHASHGTKLSGARPLLILTGETKYTCLEAHVDQADRKSCHRP